jgi:hypothetical protein
LVANVCTTAATGTAEREAAVLLLGALPHWRTVGGDKGYDVASFVAEYEVAALSSADLSCRPWRCAGIAQVKRLQQERSHTIRGDELPQSSIRTRRRIG